MLHDNSNENKNFLHCLLIVILLNLSDANERETKNTFGFFVERKGVSNYLTLCIFGNFVFRIQK